MINERGNDSKKVYVMHISRYFDMYSTNAEKTIMKSLIYGIFPEDRLLMTLARTELAGENILLVQNILH